jgi:peptide/nickel transport system permease protein
LIQLRATALARRIGRNVVQALLTILAIVVLSFFLLRAAPGDLADVLAGQSGAATAESVAEIRSRLGLELPALTQLANYLTNLSRFNLGMSGKYNIAVSSLILERFPNTLLLMGTTLAFAIVTGVLLGVVMATNVGGWTDKILSILALVFYSVPGFWAGLMLTVVFSVKLGWLPSGGIGSIGQQLSGIDSVIDQLRYLVLPALSLGLFFVAIYARLTRASMLEVARQDFVRTAAAKGLSKSRIAFRHILRNALIPIVTVMGLHIAMLMGGSIVTETIFSWPGLGSLAYDAIFSRDYMVLLGIFLFSAIFVLLINFLVDLIHVLLDPRIRETRAL